MKSITSVEDHKVYLQNLWFNHCKERDERGELHSVHTKSYRLLGQQLQQVLNKKLWSFIEGKEFDLKYKNLLDAYNELFTWEQTVAVDFDCEFELYSDVTVYFNEFEKVKRIINKEEEYWVDPDYASENVDTDRLCMGDSRLSRNEPQVEVNKIYPNLEKGWSSNPPKEEED